MASLTISGTGDELRAIGSLIIQSAAAVHGGKQTSVTLDTAASGAAKCQVQGPDGTTRRC
jgi:hypothetical protein